MKQWPVQEAKTKFSELLEQTRIDGPQTVTRHGRARAVVLSVEDYQALVASKTDFKAHLLGGPHVADFPVERSRDLGRTVEF